MRFPVCPPGPGAIPGLFLALAIGGLAPAAPAAAEPTVPLPTVIVLDASGSMKSASTVRRGQTALRRGEVATTVVEGLLRAAAARAAAEPAVAAPVIGLVRFGYLYADVASRPRHPRACEDVEVIQSPVALTPATRRLMEFESGSARPYASTGNGFDPKGETPLVAAMRRAADILQPGGGNIVVVTDLEASRCPADPCASTLSPAERLPANVTVRFVVAPGLGGSRNDIAEKFATCVGAQFRDPRTLEEARDVSSDITQSLLARPGVRLALAFEPQPLLPAGFSFAELGLTLRTARNQGSTRDIPVTTPALRIPGIAEGRYTARFVDPAGSGIGGIAPFEFTARDPEPTQTVRLPPATLTLTARDAQGRPAQAAVAWTVVDAAGRTVTGLPATSFAEITLPPGTFRVAATVRGQTVPAREITLRFGGRGELVFDFAIDPLVRRGTLRFSVRDSTGEAVNDVPVSFLLDVIEAGEADIADPRSRERVLVQGRYRVRPMLAGQPLAPLEVPLLPDQVVRVVVQLEPPVLRVTLRDAAGNTITPENAAFDVLRLRADGAAEVVMVGRGPVVETVTRAGKHQVFVQLGDRHAMADVTVPAYGTVETILTLP